MIVSCNRAKPGKKSLTQSRLRPVSPFRRRPISPYSYVGLFSCVGQGRKGAKVKRGFDAEGHGCTQILLQSPDAALGIGFKKTISAVGA
jgi:hypothetical protein